MPPRRRPVQELELEELRQQIQQLQEIVNAQRIQLEGRRELQGNDSDSSGSSSTSNRRPRRQVSRTDDIRVEIPEFEGKLQPDEFVDWLQTVERIFEYKEIPEERKVKIIAVKLKKHASIWWENLKKKREREGKSKIRTWEKMRKALNRKFLPPNFVQDNFIQLQNLRQKNLSVEEYTREFEQLMMKCDIQEREEQTIARYLGGLNADTAHIVQLQQYGTLNDVIRLSLRIEKQQPKKSSYQSSSSFPYRNSANTRKPQVQQPSTSNSNPPKPNKEVNSRVTKCFRCQGFGHIASNCPNRRVITIIEGEIHEASEEDEGPVFDDEPEYDEEPVYDEEITPADQGESLVIRRSLHTTMAKEEPWLRHNIFHTRCTT